MRTRPGTLAAMHKWRKKRWWAPQKVRQVRFPLRPGFSSPTPAYTTNKNSSPDSFSLLGPALTILSSGCCLCVSYSRN